MNGHHEAKVPVEEVHQHSLCLYDVSVGGVQVSWQSCQSAVVFLNILDEYQLIVNLIIL